MMIYITVRGFVLQRKGVTFLDIRHIRIFNLVAIHVEIMNRDLCSRISNILKGDHIILECELQFLRCLSRLKVLTEDIICFSLCYLTSIFRCLYLFRKITTDNILRRFKNICCRTRDSKRLGFRDFNLRMIFQNIVYRV